MDSWLAYTLGYPTEVTASDIQVCQGEPTLIFMILTWPGRLHCPSPRAAVHR